MNAGDVHEFHGVHILGEMYGIDSDLLNDLKLLESCLNKGIELSGASLCGMQSKQFDPSGVTLLALLSESHASIHTYPDKKALFFDAFTCGDHCRPEAIADALIEVLKPEKHELKRVSRGER